MSLPSQTLRRTSLPSTTKTYHLSSSQCRHASFLRRPLRPYTFTQLVTLSDGSTYLSRTTSPAPIYKSTKDSRNSIMWQPSMGSLRGIEEDEAGRLKAFRSRFGRGWDVEAQEEDEAGAGEETGADAKATERKAVVEEEPQMSLMDLISSEYKGEAAQAKEGETAAAEKRAAKKAAKRK